MTLALCISDIRRNMLRNSLIQGVEPVDDYQSGQAFEFTAQKGRRENLASPPFSLGAWTCVSERLFSHLSCPDMQTIEKSEQGFETHYPSILKVAGVTARFPTCRET